MILTLQRKKIKVQCSYIILIWVYCFIGEKINNKQGKETEDKYNNVSVNTWMCAFHEGKNTEIDMIYTYKEQRV